MLKSEADVVRALRGCVTLQDMYDACAAQADIARDGGLRRLDGHGTDRVWKRRVRGAVQQQRKAGHARRVARSTWLMDAPAARATVFVLIGADAALRDVELRVQEACELLGALDVPADLILTDPPYALARDAGALSAVHHYRRDHRQVVAGYVDVAPEAYRPFTREWVEHAAGALRPGGQLVVVTGPQRAAHVQIAAEDAGLTWVSSIAARRTFPLFHRRRPAPAHWTVTCMSQGELYHPDRVFHAPDWQLARSGRRYPTDWWADNGRADRPGALRYDNALPDLLVERLIAAFSDPGELVCDPFVGSGTVLLACLGAGRRFVGGDLNADAVRFAAARVIGERPELIAS